MDIKSNACYGDELRQLTEPALVLIKLRAIFAIDFSRFP